MLENDEVESGGDARADEPKLEGVSAGAVGVEIEGLAAGLRGSGGGSGGGRPDGSALSEGMALPEATGGTRGRADASGAGAPSEGALKPKLSRSSENGSPSSGSWPMRRASVPEPARSPNFASSVRRGTWLVADRPGKVNVGFMAQRFALDNGLTVLFEEHRAAKVAALQVWVKAGSADERGDQAGLAHLHEHMLFKGTSRRGPGEVASAIESSGGEINAWTSFDQTVYHVVIASRFTREGLDVLGDMIRRSTFDPGELSREIEVVCEEIKRSLDAPQRKASRDLFATAFQVHPYQRPVIGWEETVRGFTRDQVLEFYGRHYVPANVVLSIVGDLSLEEARAWAEESFGGDWGRPSYAGPVERAREPAQGARRFHFRSDDVREAYLNLAFAIPAVDHPDTPALDLLAMIAGQGHASRLLLEIKRKRSLVNEIHAYAYTPKDPGLWTTSMTLPAAKLAEAFEETVRVLAELRTQRVPEEELHRVKALVESDAVYQRETVQGLARKLGFYETSAGGIEAEKRYYEQIARVTPERLRAVAQTYLDFDRATVTGLFPQGTGFDERAAAHALEGAMKRVGPPAEPPKPSAPEPMRVIAPRAATRGVSGIIEERLPSGARVLIREEPAVPLFAMRAAFLGGLRYERSSDNGLTLLLGRMLTRGTPSRDAEAISRRIDAFAGSLHGNAGRNSVGMRGEFLSKHFAGAFDLFADCLLHPSFPDAEFEHERALQLQDVHTRDDKPSGVAFELFAKTLFHAHPYRMSTLGERQTLEALHPDTLREYHRRYCDPSQLVLSVVGDVRADEVLARAHEAFGKSFGHAAQPPPVPDELPPSTPREAMRTLAKAQTNLVLGFRGARLTDRWRHALEVLSTILSGQGGRLFIELRDKKSMAYSVSSLTMEGIEPGYFAVYMGTSPEKVPAALAGIREQLERIRDEKVSEVELARAREHLIGTHEIGLQRNGARAGLLALDALYGLGQENFLHFADRISAVTVEDVQAAARRVIDFSKSALAVVGP